MRATNYIRYWRDLRGLTQVELARKARLNRDTIARLEGGSRTGNMKTLMSIALALDVTIDEIQNGPHRTDENHVNSPEATLIGHSEGELDTIPLLTDVPAGPWKSWIDDFPVGYGEGRVPRYDLKGDHLFALRIDGDSMVPDLYPGDVIIMNPEKAFTGTNGKIGVIRYEEEIKIRKVFLRGDNYVLQPSNPNYEPEVVPVTGTTIFKIIERRVNDDGKF